MPATQTKIAFPEQRKTYTFDKPKPAVTPSKKIDGVRTSARLKYSCASDSENTPQKITFEKPKLAVTPTKKLDGVRSSARLKYDDASDTENTPKKTVRGKRSSESTYDEHSHWSPPKLRASDENAKGSPSPSSALNKLTISPSKGLADVGSQRESLSPKCLFGKDSSFRRARQALHSSAPDTMPGREAQMEELTHYLLEKLRLDASGTLYISGPPGTGKTACLSNILKAPEFQNEYKRVYVNCTTMRSSGCIFSRICEELCLKVKGRTEKEYVQVLAKHWMSNKKMTLLVLDEIDQLESKKQTVLYTVFEWPSIPGSRLVLIGIANALDLTDRILPRLQALLKLKPRLMHFAPYSKEELVKILTQRLKEMDVLDVFSPSSLQLLAGKVAAVSGDVRRALDIGRRVLELAENKKVHSAALTPTTDHSANTTSPKKKANSSVDLKVVMNVLNSVYGTSTQLSSPVDEEAEEDTFPLQQKLLVCSLVLILKEGKTKDVTIGKLHEVYKKVCKRRNLTAVEMGDLFGLCQLVETRGIIQVQVKKETRMSKIRLMWDEEEVGAALQDRTLLATILNDPMLL